VVIFLAIRPYPQTINSIHVHFETIFLLQKPKPGILFASRTLLTQQTDSEDQGDNGWDEEDSDEEFDQDEEV
jgi:hypothetical protein